MSIKEKIKQLEAQLKEIHQQRMLSDELYAEQFVDNTNYDYLADQANERYYRLLEEF